MKANSLTRPIKRSPCCTSILAWTFRKEELGLAVVVLCLLAAGPLSTRVEAFSLLGPYADWMDVEKGYRLPDDIGGPMNITEGYRWNIPVLTYGFDQSFMDYFGSNGVAAVEQAIAMLNKIPPASVIDLQAYALRAWRANWRAESAELLDLKSQTLGLLLQQMGLTDPVRNAFCIRDYQVYPGPSYYFDVIMRSFDPVTAQPSHYVNGVLLSYQVFWMTPAPGQFFCDAQEIPVDAEAGGFEPVVSMSAHGYSPYGRFVTNLTREDIAGLRYLLSGGEVHCEALLPDVHLVNTNEGPLVVTADRPGIEKVTFARHPAGPLNGRFLPFTNRWTDIYYGYFLPGYQEVERITTRPDILFTAADLGASRGWSSTGTTNWVNNAELNGNPGGLGPGVIQPPVTITYNSIGPFYIVPPAFSTNAFPTELSSYLVSGWGSFNGTTNPPITYPVGQTPFQPTEVRLTLRIQGKSYELRWPLPGRPYQRFAFQTGTNLTDWTTITTLTNSGATFEYQADAPPNEPARFFMTSPLP
ncbi:MAG TPA: hypothetical protein VJA21_25995 [Verrucomicrobiae bacterium]